MQAPSPRSSSQRRLLFGLSGGAIAVLGLCLVIGVAGGIALYLYRHRPNDGTAIVEYILDASPRMALPGETGAPRLQVAGNVLAEILRPADPAMVSGLRVFGSGAVAQACQDTNLLVPLAPSSQKLISDKASTVQAGQSTDSALAQAIVAAIRDLATKRGPHSLVVVTGGADSCNPNAGQVVAQEAGHAAIDLNTYVVGFGVSDSEGEAIKVSLDQTPKTHYLGAKTEAELRIALRDVQDNIEHPNAPLATMPPTATATATATPVPTATATPMPPTPTIYTTPLPGESFFMDIRTKEVSSTVVLASGHTYSIQLTGTFSNWDPGYWGQYGLCAGTPQPKPMFPSAGIGNGLVGEDPFYWFAFPRGPGTQDFLCAKVVIKPPYQDALLKFSLDGGRTFAPYAPAPAYTQDHTYPITLVGQGHPLIIQFQDGEYKDNRGQIKVDITP